MHISVYVITKGSIEMTKEEFFGKFKSLYLWGNLAAMVLVLMLLFLAMKWWLVSYTHHGEVIEVPNLVAKSEAEAGKLLAEKGLQLKVVATSYVKDLPGGSVISQDPKAGASVKDGRIVYVTVNSLTVPKERIPEIIGFKSYRGAQSDLLDLEFELTDPKYVPGYAELVMGILCNGQEVQNGDEVAKYSRLTLVIGDGSIGSNSGTEDLPELPEEIIEQELNEEPEVEEWEEVPSIYE